LLVIVLVGLNGFFVAAEFALVSVRRTRIEELVSQGNASARVAKKALEDPDSVIAATQLGITLASLGLGWVGEPALSSLIVPLLHLLPEQWVGVASHSISAAIAFTIITFLHVVIGELAPKSIALQYPEETSLTVARPTLWSEWIFKPFIWVLNGAGNGLLRLVGIDPSGGHGTTYSVDELRMLVQASAVGGVLQTGEQEMLEAVFDFRNMLARQVLIPRTELTMLRADQTLSDIVALPREEQYSKYPVYEDTPDNIVGILHMRDTLTWLAGGKLDTPVQQLVRPAVYIPESMPVANVLPLFREERQHIAMVLDEFGGTAGLVTLEDILEEIAGDIPDEDEHGMPTIISRPDGSTLVSGLALIEDVNEHFELELNDPNYDTIAGFVMGQLDRIPAPGDEVTVDGIRFRVLAMDGKRIARLVVPSLPERKKRGKATTDPDHA
jgi:CBS domain containing-hemolysin-like protein